MAIYFEQQINFSLMIEKLQIINYGMKWKLKIGGVAKDCKLVWYSETPNDRPI